LTNGASTLHGLWWLWIPLAVLAAQIVLELTLPVSILSPLHSEQGPHEAVQFLIISLAFLTAMRILLLPETRRSALLTAWIGTAALCSFYVAGEEMSWGQHLMHWTTPEFWHSFNDQGETNLHNTSAWLDQKPRLILEIAVLTGGLAVPLLQKFRPGWLPARFSLLYPTPILTVTALLVLGVNIADWVDSALKDRVIFTRASEVEELYMFYFVLLYLITLHRRIAQNQG
jgi:hypothetical protein